MSDIEVFDFVYKSQGGVFKYEEFPFPFGLFLEWTRSVVEAIPVKKQIPHIYSNYIDNAEFNASASFYLDRYYIGCNAGTFLIFDNLFNKFLSCRECLKEIGNPLLEEWASAMYNANLKSLDQWLMSVSHDELHKQPKDNLRSSYAQLLTVIVMKFVFAHELGHIYNGHLGLIRKEDKAFCLFELESQSDFDAIVNKQVVSLLDRQTLELDADSYAAKIILGEMLSLVDNAKDFREGGLTYIYEDIEKAIFAYVFAVFTGFNIMNIYPVSIVDVEKFIHPPEGLRQHNFFGMIITAFERYGINVNSSRVVEITRTAIKECENCFNCISEVGFNKYPRQFASNRDSMDYFVRVMNNWGSVRSKLEPFAYVNLAPISPLSNDDIFS